MTETAPGAPEKPKEEPGVVIEDEQLKMLAGMAGYLEYMLRPAPERPRVKLIDEGVVRVQLTTKDVITFELRFPDDFSDDVQQQFLDHPYKDHSLQLGISLAISAPNHRLTAAQEGEQNAKLKSISLTDMAEQIGVEPVELFYAYNTAWGSVLEPYIKKRDERRGYGSTRRRKHPPKGE